ncbi:MAG TPA: trypsin-like peptidase domain-containing protein [Vicinamibacteria bacterium]|nr:trypsin-like peptidase domain-containing protein [Vicinamibacteria bacterium]
MPLRLAFAVALLLAAPVAGSQSAAQRPQPSELARFNGDLQDLIARVKPAVVQVLVRGYAAPVGAAEAALLPRQFSAGSGVVLDPDGYVVTNAHVVHGARTVQVLLPSARDDGRSVLKSRGRPVGAQVVGVDRETDIAVLKVAETGLVALPLGDSESVRQGQVVLALGSPLGLEDSVSLGVVSAVARQLEPEHPMIYIQTDASINRGNSGGPLVDTEGRVIGINTLILSQSGGSEGIGFAAPAHIVGSVYEQIRQSGRVRRGEIGARAQTITPVLARGLGLPRDRGVVIADVKTGSAAQRAGLGIGDVVLSIDGKPLENARQLDVNLYRRTPGTSVSLAVLRGATLHPIVVTVGERPRDRQRLLDRVSPERNLVPRLGLLALDLDEEVQAMVGPLRAQAGVVVAASQADALPFEDGIEAGDVIYSVNASPVADIAQLRAAIDALKPGAGAVLQVERDGQLRFVAVSVE